MKCQRCNNEVQDSKEMCTFCGAPIAPIPIPSGGKVRFGEYDWFVLEKLPDRMLIITEKVLGIRQYHHVECDITWEYSDMRKYLNGEFYDSFSNADKKLILDTEVITNDNPWYGTKGGNITVDKIFLLSIDEVIKYFGDSGQIRTRYMYPNCDWCKDEFLPWIDDQFNINRRAVDDTGVVRSWKLRSPGGNQRSVADVSGFLGDGFDQGGVFIGNADVLVDGHFSQDGCGRLTDDSSNSMNGIRPALWCRITNDNDIDGIAYKPNRER
ncbi:MAG: hypothetical protein IJX82_03685 [Clostridia bacterium]|nr:hypothetical protein [Clostridia bacterium]